MFRHSRTKTPTALRSIDRDVIKERAYAVIKYRNPYHHIGDSLARDENVRATYAAGTSGTLFVERFTAITTCYTWRNTSRNVFDNERGVSGTNRERDGRRAAAGGFEPESDLRVKFTRATWAWAIKLSSASLRPRQSRLPTENLWAHRAVARNKQLIEVSH